ncbi:MAG: Ig-like domain-containing protein [Bacteroidales bacterium]|nr:Ig-like domain-containing protein [Bacteroidales bacterium]
MKKVFFLALAVLLSGCYKKDDIPEKVYMSGKWTQVNEQSMTSGYIEFQEGKMSRYISSIGEVVAMEDALWHCSSSDFTEESVCSYYIQDKCLYVDGKPSGRMEDDELYIDDKLYCSFNDFEEDYYVTIVPDVTDNVITLPFCAAEQEFSVSLTRSLPHSSLSVSTSDEWIKSLGLDEGNVSFVTEAPVEDREGSIRISYPGAEDKVVSVKQKCERFIRPAVTEMSFDCISREVSLSYMIENPVEGEVLTVTTDAEWISEIRVEKDRVVVLLASNEDGTDREAVLRLSYKEANPVEVKVSQSFPSLTLSQESQETDYSSKTLSFTYSVNNAAEGQVLEAVSGVAWISGIAVDGNTVTYTVSENNSGSSRSGEITLTYAGVVRIFTITQSYSAASITLSSSSQTTDYTTKKLNFTVNITNPKENLSLSGEATAEWIQDLTINGNTVSYTVDKNTSANQREDTITINYESDSKEFKLIQTGHPVTELTLNKISVTLLAGESEILAASAFPLDTKVQWSSSSPAIASVDQNGKVTGLDNGTTIITVASADGTKTARCEVTVIVPVTGVSLDRTSAEIIKGESMTLTATVTPSNAMNKNVMWTSSDPSVATVSQSGVVTALEFGTTTISVNSFDGNKSATCVVTVVKRSVSGGMEGTEDEDWGI